MKIENIYVNNKGLGQQTLEVNLTGRTKDVEISFDTPVSWLAMPPSIALEFALVLAEYARLRLALQE